MNKTIVNPYRINHKMYISLVFAFLLILCISFLIPEEKGSCFETAAEIMRNLSYGCVASTVVAWLIDYVNIKNQNKKADDIYEAVYGELKFHIAGFIEVWSESCNIVFKEQEYRSEKHRWFVLRDFRFEFRALELELERAEITDQFWESMGAITQDLIRYIHAWKDISFYNNVFFCPRRFWDDSTELSMAICYDEMVEGKRKHNK